MKHKIIAKCIQLSVPFLNIFRNPPAWPFTLSELEMMETDTLGKCLFEFLDSRDMGYLPKYEVHDAYHALLGYGTTVTEELKLQAFMWGNKNSTFAGRVLLILGVIVFPKKFSILKAELLKGKNAKPLKEHSLTEMIQDNIFQLRKDLCIN